MTKMTQSFLAWCFKFHRELYTPLMFGHVELLTNELYQEFINWVQSDEGRQHLKSGSKRWDVDGYFYRKAERIKWIPCDDAISRRAAIAEFSCCELTPDGGIDANYAIDFLEQMPSAQPEHNADDERKIADLHKMVNYLLSRLEQQIQEVEKSNNGEIVRCKDCVYFPEGTGADHDLEFPEEFKCPCECEDYWYSWKPADDWFCANGKRKEEKP